MMKGKTLRKHSLYEKTAASVLLKLFKDYHFNYLKAKTANEYMVMRVNDPC